ncbi:MAG: hypothetical protein ACI3XA_05635 [Clostridia bacterium]
MCGLFGFHIYGDAKLKNLADLTNSLAAQSTVRGVDATGIAFNSKGLLRILKESKSAMKIDFKHGDEIKAVIGHTRHSTQGSEKKNFNNHPFYGRAKIRFALAHNGVINNDIRLRKELNLPSTKVETDSYIAVQLIECQKKLDFESLRFMAEKIEGSFSFVILDEKNNVYLVKGDSPLSIIHFPRLKMYVFASTDEILYRSIIDYPPLFKEIKQGAFEEVEIEEGDILKLCANGETKREHFKFDYWSGMRWYDYAFHPTKTTEDPYGEYIETLKAVASAYGYLPDEIDHLLREGFSPEEIEDYLYGLEV